MLALFASGVRILGMPHQMFDCRTTAPAAVGVDQLARSALDHHRHDPVRGPANPLPDHPEALLEVRVDAHTDGFLRRRLVDDALLWFRWHGMGLRPRRGMGGNRRRWGSWRTRRRRLGCAAMWTH